jgi:hypothetical protein
MAHRCTVKNTSAVTVVFFFNTRFPYTALSAAGRIQMLFLFLTFFCPIIFGASAYGILPTVSLPAAERAAKIIAAGIAWVGEKQNMTMPASSQIFSQVGLFFENGPDSPVILRNDTANLFLAVPVRNELKTRLYLYYKKAKCSLMSLMYVGIPSLSFFYFAVNKVQRGFFFCKA